MKKRIYSIIYLICLILLLNSIPFNLFIMDQIITFIITLSIKLFSIFYILSYIKKDNLNKIKTNKLDKSVFKLIPLLLLCCSNFIVVLFQNSELKTSINYFNIITGLITAVGVGIIEELLFRSQVLEEILRNKNKVSSIFYSSLIFGSVHLLNISSIASIPIVSVQVAYTFFLGIILAFIYITTKNIFIPIIFHILFNFINDILTIELFKLKWELTFFIINILIGLIIFTYVILISFINKERCDVNAAENLDN